MITFEYTEVVGWEHAIRGMRNPMNSWLSSDSAWVAFGVKKDGVYVEKLSDDFGVDWEYVIGPKDQNLMKRLRDAGTDHRKFMRMIAVYVDITAPRYWWAEMDTYKVGTVANSCSTMHKITEKEFMLEDFSCEHLILPARGNLKNVIESLNFYRNLYLQFDSQPDSVKETFECDKKNVWWQIIQLLPGSYNQKRTVMLNYEVLANIYHSRKNHKLDEWRVGFMDWIKSLPYSELITGEEDNESD